MSSSMGSWRSRTVSPPALRPAACCAGVPGPVRAGADAAHRARIGPGSINRRARERLARSLIGFLARGGAACAPARLDAEGLQRRVIPHQLALVPARNLVAVAVDPYQPIAALGTVSVTRMVFSGRHPPIPDRCPERRVDHMLVATNLEGFHRPMRLGGPVHAGPVPSILGNGGGQGVAVDGRG